MIHALEPPREGHIWDFYYELLQGFVQSTGHADVPKNRIEKGFALGIWVHKQRANRRWLTPQQVTALETIKCWFWENNHTIQMRREQEEHDLWQSRYELLIQYKNREGHCLVPRRHKEDQFRLGEWVRNQQRTHFTMPPGRREMLEKLEGWSWEQVESSWSILFNLSQVYCEREGTAKIPAQHVEQGYKLGVWAARQQKHYRKGRLEDHRARMLASLPGWEWDPQTAPSSTAGAEKDDDMDRFTREVWNILLGHHDLTDVMAAHLTVQRLHETGILKERTVNIGSEELRRIGEAFDRGVELGWMDRPEKGKIRALRNPITRSQ